MDENKGKSSDTPKTLLFVRIKRVILLFFTVLGGILFFSSISIAVYIALGFSYNFLHNFPGYNQYEEAQIPIADGRRLYQDMKLMEKERAEGLAEMKAEMLDLRKRGRGDEVSK